jgi:hypothetical protein
MTDTRINNNRNNAQDNVRNINNPNYIQPNVRNINNRNNVQPNVGNINNRTIRTSVFGQETQNDLKPPYKNTDSEADFAAGGVVRPQQES